MDTTAGLRPSTSCIDKDDAKRWTGDGKLNPKKFKSALAMTVTSDTTKRYLLADSVFLKAHAETGHQLRSR